jgi:hypothetical protein
MRTQIQRKDMHFLQKQPNSQPMQPMQRLSLSLSHTHEDLLLATTLAKCWLLDLLHQADSIATVTPSCNRELLQSWTTLTNARNTSESATFHRMVLI